MRKHYELRHMGKLIASGTLDQIVAFIEDEGIAADIRKLRESMKLTDEYNFYMGLYELKKISNPK